MKTLYLFFLMCSSFCILQEIQGQIIGMPYQLQYCTPPSFTPKANDPDCIRFAATYDKATNLFSNADQGDWKKVHTSDFLALINPDDNSRFAIRVQDGQFVISTQEKDWQNYIIGRTKSFKFKGWDGKGYEVNYNDFVDNNSTNNRQKKDISKPIITGIPPKDTGNPPQNANSFIKNDIQSSNNPNSITCQNHYFINTHPSRKIRLVVKYDGSLFDSNCSSNQSGTVTKVISPGRKELFFSNIGGNPDIVSATFVD